MSDEKIDINLSTWAQSTLFLNGAPLSLEGRDYILPVYDNGYNEFLIMAGRQTEKSTTAAAMAVGYATAFPFFSVLYGAPDVNKIRQWSHDKLTPFLNRSPYIRKEFMSGDDVLNNVSEKRLNNGSQIILRNDNADGDNFRGQSVDLLLLDEIQDMLPTAIIVGKEALSHSKWKIKRYTGTPKTMESPIEGLWKISTQTEWLVKCNHCSGGDLSYHNNLGMSNITPDGLVCTRCGRPIDARDGQWVNGRDARIKAMRLSQLMVSWTDFEELYYEKLLRYPTAQFMNEVLGISFDSASKFLTEDQLRELCAEGGHDMLGAADNEAKSNVTVAGIDWGVNVEGGANTVLIIGIARAPERLKIVYARKFSHRVGMTDQMKIILDKLKEFRVNCVVADWGASGDRNVRIAEEIGPTKIIQCQYTGSGTISETYTSGTALLRINRTMALSDFKTDLIERNMFTLPNFEQFQPFVDDMLSEYVDVKTDGSMYYSHNIDTTDDALQAMVYVNLARKIRFGMPILNVIPKVSGRSTPHIVRMHR